MRKISFASLTFACLVVVFGVVSSCVEVKGKTNPYDPSNPNYKAPASNTVLRGWKIDTSTGDPNGASLLCLNVPPGQRKVVQFTNPTANALTGACEGSNSFKATGIQGTLYVTINLTNLGTANGMQWSFNITSDQPSFSYGYHPTTPGSVTMVANLTFIVTVSNGSDTDGSNQIWIDRIDAKAAATQNAQKIQGNETLSGDLAQ